MGPFSFLGVRGVSSQHPSSVRRDGGLIVLASRLYPPAVSSRCLAPAAWAVGLVACWVVSSGVGGVVRAALFFPWFLGHLPG